MREGEDEKLNWPTSGQFYCDKTQNVDIRKAPFQTEKNIFQIISAQNLQKKNKIIIIKFN